ncbi:hypothetical protein CK203_046138 [Vitis vinifera]|uniref:DUF4283 domain-containing protein n=1 Tax=Vitis vinifera TaxID=29760 RepID=A0A438I496_VITVI|nr:hypothetical protein CK203_046138 [Vitis vinifera]
MVRSVKVFVERKTFSVRLEGEHRGTWCSITEHSRGSAFVLGFEKEAVGWMIEHLTKAIEMKGHLGFNRKFRGKRCAHLMERARRAEDGRILKECCLQCWWSPCRMQLKKEGNTEEKFLTKSRGSLHRSFAKVVSGEGPRGGGLIPVGRWARAVVCECIEDSVNWVEDFSTDEKMVAKENAEIEGKFRGGWIELRGFHFISGEGKNRNERQVSPPSFTRGDRWGLGVYSCRRSGRKEDFRRGSVKGESTREAFASNTGTGGGRRVEKIRSTAGEDAVSGG